MNENEKDKFHASSGSRMKKSIHARLEHFTWAWYTITMATGGMALLLGSQPHTFHGLVTIGTIIFIFDLLLFLCITTLIVYRFTHFPGTFTASITHPTESLFYATFWLSLINIISCMGKYGVPNCGPWLVTVFRVLFWMYFALTFTSAVGHYYLLFTSPSLKVQDATPAWDLPIFPFMLCGTAANVGVPFQSTLAYKMSMLVGGLTAQGLGMMVSVMMFGIYVRRMINFGLPSPGSRPAMFISVGPPSFTSLAIIGLAREFPADPRADWFGGVEITRQIVLVMATFTSVFIWSLGFWFFCVSLVANLVALRMGSLKFKLNWWAFVFPNVGFTIATIDIGKVFRSEGITWVGSGMTCLLVVMYIVVFYNHVMAVLRGDIMMDGKDEDFFVPEKMTKVKKEGGRAEGESEEMDTEERGAQDFGQEQRQNLRRRNRSLERKDEEDAG